MLLFQEVVVSPVRKKGENLPLPVHWPLLKPATGKIPDLYFLLLRQGTASVFCTGKVNKVFHVALDAGNRAFNNAADIAAPLKRRLPDILNYLRTQGRITDNASLAHLSLSHFKLGLD